MLPEVLKKLVDQSKTLTENLGKSIRNSFKKIKYFSGWKL